MISITDLITDNEKLASTVTTVVHTLRTTYKRREKTYIPTIQLTYQLHIKRVKKVLLSSIAKNSILHFTL